MQIRKLGCAAFCLLALGAVSTAQAEPLKIPGSWVGPVANWASIWLEKKNLAVHFGQSYVFESSRYAGTPPMITAMANNELEMGDLRVVADEFQDGAPGYRADDFQVLSDGPIQKVEDLKGKVIATNAAGSGVDVALLAMLRKHGLEANRDYTIVEAPFPGMRAMLAEKKVDIIPPVLPFALDPELKKIAHPLFSITDAIGVSQFAMWAMRKPFIDKNRAAIVDFMEDTMRIERWYLDPKNHDAVAEIASRITKQPPERFGWLFTKNDYYRNPDMRPDLDALQKNVDMTKDLGFGKGSFDVNAHSDLSLIEEAAKRLK